MLIRVLWSVDGWRRGWKDSLWLVAGAICGSAVKVMFLRTGHECEVRDVAAFWNLEAWSDDRGRLDISCA